MPKKKQQNWEVMYTNLKRRYDSLKEAAEQMAETIEAGKEENAMLQALNYNADMNVGQQKDIVRQNIAQTKGEKDKLVDEIVRLRKILREEGIKVA